MAGKVHAIVTNKIIEALERGVVPWSRPWISVGRSLALHQNLASRRPYRGINQILLSLEVVMRGFTSPYWLTWNQIQNLYGRVRKGERSSLVVFYRIWEKERYDSDKGTYVTDKIPILRYYKVWNVDQVDNIDTAPPEGVTLADPAAISQPSAERIVAGYPNGPAIKHAMQDMAAYSPAFDVVLMPELSQFSHASGYYHSLFHELAHSTGHPSRLNRPGIAKADQFGTERYAKEELIAELAASFLCYEAGIEPEVDNSAAYIEGWLRTLRNDNSLIITAAGQASRAVDYILGAQDTEAAHDELDVAVQST